MQVAQIKKNRHSKS